MGTWDADEEATGLDEEVCAEDDVGWVLTFVLVVGAVDALLEDTAGRLIASPLLEDAAILAFVGWALNSVRGDLLGPTLLDDAAAGASAVGR